MGNLKKKRRKKIAKHKRKKQLKLLRHKNKWPEVSFPVLSPGSIRDVRFRHGFVGDGRLLLMAE